MRLSSPCQTWLVAAALFAATHACIPDVNVTGIRGEGGSASSGGGSSSGASGGGAGGPIHVVYRNNTPDFFVQHRGDDDCLKLVCPLGYKVLSGGGGWDVPFPGGPARITVESSRPTADDEWSFCGYAAEPNVYEWYIEAMCGTVDTTIVSTDPVQHPGGGRACIQATCPAGTKVVGGGGAWEAAGGKISWESSRPVADGWEICGSADVAGMYDWAVDAVCAAVDTEVVLTTLTIHDGGDQCIEARCPTGKVAVGGGGEWKTPANAAEVLLNAYGPLVEDEAIGWSMCARSAQPSPFEHDWLGEVVCL